MLNRERPIIDQPMCARVPATCDRRVPAQSLMVVAQLGRHPRSPSNVVHVSVQPVSPLVGGKRRVMLTQHPRGEGLALPGRRILT